MIRCNLLKNLLGGILLAGTIGLCGTSSASAADRPHNRWTNQELSTNFKALQHDVRGWQRSRDAFKERHAGNRGGYGGPLPRSVYQRDRNQLIRQRDTIRKQLTPIRQEMQRRHMPLSRGTPSGGFSGQKILNGRRLF